MLAKPHAIPRLVCFKFSEDMMMPTSTQALMAMGPPRTEGGEQVPLWVNLGPLVLLIVVFYFALIRPQQKRAKQHAEMVKHLKTGDKILTNGGIIGTVVGIKDKSISLRSSDTKLEIQKNAVSEVLERSSSGAAASSNES